MHIVEYVHLVKTVEVLQFVNMEDNALNVRSVEVFVNIVEYVLDVKTVEVLFIFLYNISNSRQGNIFNILINKDHYNINIFIFIIRLFFTFI